jgi:hypothetical protein
VSGDSDKDRGDADPAFEPLCAAVASGLARDPASAGATGAASTLLGLSRLAGRGGALPQPLLAAAAGAAVAGDGFEGCGADQISALVAAFAR